MNCDTELCDDVICDHKTIILSKRIGIKLSITVTATGHLKYYCLVKNLIS